MKKANRITRYMLAFMLGAFAISVLILANKVDAETDAQLEQIDNFIEAYEASYEQVKKSPKTAENVVKTEQAASCEQVNLEPATSQELGTDFASEELGHYSNITLTPEEFYEMGIIDWNGWRFTWYSENVLPGGGLNIPGRWSDGDFVRDGDGFLCVASNELPYGSEVETPFGWARVYDAIGDGVTGIIDIYVSF